MLHHLIKTKFTFVLIINFKTYKQKLQEILKELITFLFKMHFLSSRERHTLCSDKKTFKGRLCSIKFLIEEVDVADINSHPSVIKRIQFCRIWIKLEPYNFSCILKFQFNQLLAPITFEKSKNISQHFIAALQFRENELLVIYITYCIFICIFP